MDIKIILHLVFIVFLYFLLRKKEKSMDYKMWKMLSSVGIILLKRKCVRIIYMRGGKRDVHTCPNSYILYVQLFEDGKFLIKTLVLHSTFKI